MTDKSTAIQELENIAKQLQSVIEQLKVRDVAYYASPELAAMMDGIPGLQWSCGNIPGTNIGSFLVRYKEK